MSVTTNIVTALAITLLSGCSMITESIRVLPGQKFDHSEKYKFSQTAKDLRGLQLQNECSYPNKKSYCVGIHPYDVQRLLEDLNQY